MATALQIANAQATQINAEYRVFAGPTYKSLIAGGLTTTLVGWTAPDIGKPSGWTDITSRTNYASDFNYQLRGNSSVWSAQLSGENYDATYLGIDLAIMIWRQIGIGVEIQGLPSNNLDAYSGSIDDGTTDTFTDWTSEAADTNNIIDATANAVSGVAVKITLASTGYANIWRSADIVGNQQYTVSYYATGATAANAGIIIMDSADNAVLASSAVDVTTTWQNFRFNFTTPASCTEVIVVLSPDVAGTVIYDDISIFATNPWSIGAWERELIGQIVSANDHDNYKHGQRWQRTVRGGDSLIERYNAPRLVAGGIDITTGATATVTAGGELADPSLESKSGEFVGGLYSAVIGNIVDGKPNTVFISDDIPGSNLLLNHSFETFTGTANDTTTDTFTSWTNTLPNAGDRILAVQSLDSYMYVYAHYGISACKIISNAASAGASIYQDVTVQPDHRYRLRFWKRINNSTDDGSFEIYDNTNAASLGGNSTVGSRSTAWSEYSESAEQYGHQFTTLPGCVSVRITMKADPGSTVYYDDIELQDDQGGTDINASGVVTVSEVFFRPTAGFPLAQSWWVEVCSQRDAGGKAAFKLVSMQTWHVGTEKYTDVRYLPDAAHEAVWSGKFELSDGRFGIICANRKIFERMTGGAPNAEFIVDASDYAPTFTLSPTDGLIATQGSDSRHTIIWAPSGAERYGRGGTDPDDHWSGAPTGVKEHTFDSDGLPEFCGHSIRKTLKFYSGTTVYGDPAWFFKNEYPSPGRYSINVGSVAVKVELPENFSYLLDATDATTTAIQLDNYLGWLPSGSTWSYKGVVESDVFTYVTKEASALTGVTWDTSGSHTHAKDARVYPYDRIYYGGASAYAAQTGYPVDYAKLFRRKRPYIETFEMYWSYLDGDGALDYQASGWDASYNRPRVYMDGGDYAEYIVPFSDLYHNTFSWVRTVMFVIKRMTDGGRAKLNEFYAHPYMLGMNASGVPSVNTAQSSELAWYLLNTYLSWTAADFVNSATDSEHYLGNYALAMTALTSVFDDLARKTGCIVDYNPDGKVYWRTDPWWPLRDAFTAALTLDTNYIRGDVLISDEARTIDAVIVNATVVGGTEPHVYRAVFPKPIPPSTEPPQGARVEEINDIVVATDSDAIIISEIEYNKRIRTGQLVLTLTGVAPWLYPGMLLALDYDYDGTGSAARTYEITGMSRRRSSSSGNISLTDSVTLRRFI